MTRLVHLLGGVVAGVAAVALVACGGADDSGVPPDARDIDAPLDAPLPPVTPDVDGKLVINEVLATNALTNTDVTGAAGDWLEVYNPTDTPISLQNYAVTDDLTVPRKNILAGGVVVPPHGYLLLWADGQPDRGRTHLRFALDGESGDLALTRPDGTFIDRVHYDQQETDFSAAREPDGSDAWLIEWHPSPGAANPAGAGHPVGPEDIAIPPEAIPAAGDLSEQVLGYDAEPEFALTITPDNIAALRAAPRTYVPAMLNFRGRDYGPVGVKIKGGQTFTDIDHKASLRIKVSNYAPGARLFGLKDLTFNNMQSDYSMLHERLAYWLARGMGIPASRCNHMRLTVNGVAYGLYSNVETVRHQLLKRWFADPDGPLFAAKDVEFTEQYVSQFALESGPDDRTLIAGLVNALTIADPDQALAAAGAFVDLAQFRRFWAFETVIAQYDAFPYSIPGDDYFLYAEPGKKLTFMPWGVDESFFSAELDPTNVSSVLAIKCKASPSCFQAYVDQVWDLFAMAEAMNWVGERQRIIDRIAPWVLADARKEYTNAQVQQFQQELYWFVTERRLRLSAWLPPHGT